MCVCKLYLGNVGVYTAEMSLGTRLVCVLVPANPVCVYVSTD